MTFERDNRVGYNSGALWRMNLAARNDQLHGRGRRLILEPYVMAQRSELRAWVEEQRPRYHWITEKPDQRPKGHPTYSVDTIEVPNSRYTVTLKHSLEFVVVGALSHGHLVGESATGAVHNLFWLNFVQDDAGLTYLYKYASKETGNFYAGQRLLEYTRYYAEANERSNYDVTSAIDDAMKHDSTLGQRLHQRVAVDDAFRDAIEALLLTGEDEDAQHANVRRLVELNASPKDRVLAAVFDATHSDLALLGLRACQRIEHDAAFFETLVAVVGTDASTVARQKRVRAFLRENKTKRAS
jgi:hypothetical protein